MAEYKLLLPSMGEGVMEATIISWLFNEGDSVKEDDSVVEIATDKVDSEVPSEVSGVLVEQLFQVNDLVQVGQTIAIIETEGGAVTESVVANEAPEEAVAIEKAIEVAKETVLAPVDFTESDKFLSPLVKNIAKEEGISIAELQTISGTGKEGRITKADILEYIPDDEQTSSTA